MDTGRFTAHHSNQRELAPPSEMDMFPAAVGHARMGLRSMGKHILPHREALEATIVALDGVIAKMQCQKKEDGTDRRWRSGACEILPLAPDLRDLAY